MTVFIVLNCGHPEGSSECELCHKPIGYDKGKE
jgi:hypothetical protein